MAREIAVLLRQGVAPDDIGVLVRGSAARSPRLGQALRSYGVPFRLDTMRALRATGLGHSLLAALRGMATPDWPSLLTFLRGAYAAVPLVTVDSLHAQLLGMGRAGNDAALSLVDAALPDALTDVRAALRWDGRTAAGVDPDGVLVLAERMLVAAAGGEHLTGDEVREDATVLSVLQRALGSQWRAGSRGALHGCRRRRRHRGSRRPRRAQRCRRTPRGRRGLLGASYACPAQAGDLRAGTGRGRVPASDEATGVSRSRRQEGPQSAGRTAGSLRGTHR